MSSIPRCEAASISITSSEEPFAIATQAWQTLSGVGRRPLLAVDRLREDPRHRRLARSARARKEVRLPQLAELDRVPQRPHDRLLADDVVEVLRPVLPVERGHRIDLSPVARSAFEGLPRGAIASPAPVRRDRGTWEGILSAASFRT